MNDQTQPSSDLLNLPVEQQVQIAHWLLSGMPYFQAREMARDKFELATLPDNCWEAFWEEVCLPQLMQRRKRMAQAAVRRLAAAKEHPGDFEAALEDVMDQKAYELIENDQADPKEVRATLTLLLKRNELELAVSQLLLAREKFQFDAAAACLSLAPEIKEAASSNLSETEKVDKIRLKMFGYVGGKRLPHDQLLPTPIVDAQEVGGEVPPGQS